ncbi:MAG: AAA family ATPase [Oscillospiraceae bacterium]|nr:AAA family ATPase [Oscillospiraceae bacterium]
MERDIDLLTLLPYIHPAELSYQEWVNVGMALKEAGYTASDWDDWSRNDSRYHPGECERKWDTFQGAATPITGGTLVQMAKDRGWRASFDDGPGYELGWDSIIGSKDGVLVDTGWLEGKEVHEPENWDPVKDLTKYLETLFEASENVGYVTESWERDGRYLPSKGHCDRSAGELIEQLHKYGSVQDVFGDYNPEVGAWIRFNPLDGKGVKNENVTEYRYALVESDCMELEKQHAMIRELELPVACLVYSGGKSIHAIVRIEAGNYDEYRKRVDYLYGVLKKNGLQVDIQNKNPSRLSRMPGVMRGGHKQFLMGTNLGKASFREWQEWIEAATDDLPNPESLSEVWEDLPDLAPPLIEGVLRQGHKMLIAGPSKAGKSYGLIELCCAIAEGKTWLGWQCTQGRVLYVNLELDRASCLHRFRDIYTAMGWKPDNIRNLDIWNLRGKSVPMDKLAPKLIRRAAKKNYIAIIIDPIYKIITGDENSADQMAQFCNQFDLVCTELGCAVIYCHHHSKGSQGQKRSMDRASGSGVFARDPDALLDLIELEVTDGVRKSEIDKEKIKLCCGYLDRNAMNWRDEVSQDDACVAHKMLEYCRNRLCREVNEELLREVSEAEKAVQSRTAWRVEGTLREFPKFLPKYLWFDYPRHRMDELGVLKDLEADGEAPPWQRASGKAKKNAEKKAAGKKQQFEDAVANCNAGEPPTVNDLVEWFSDTGTEVAKRTVQSWVKKFGFYIDKNNGKVYRQPCGEEKA